MYDPMQRQVARHDLLIKLNAFIHDPNTKSARATITACAPISSRATTNSLRSDAEISNHSEFHKTYEVAKVRTTPLSRLVAFFKPSKTRDPILMRQIATLFSGANKVSLPPGINKDALFSVRHGYYSPEALASLANKAISEISDMDRRLMKLFEARSFDPKAARKLMKQRAKHFRFVEDVRAQFAPESKEVKFNEVVEFRNIASTRVKSTKRQPDNLPIKGRDAKTIEDKRTTEVIPNGTVIKNSKGDATSNVSDHGPQRAVKLSDVARSNSLMSKKAEVDVLSEFIDELSSGVRGSAALNKAESEYEDLLRQLSADLEGAHAKTAEEPTGATESKKARRELERGLTIFTKEVSDFLYSDSEAEDFTNADISTFEAIRDSTDAVENTLTDDDDAWRTVEEDFAALFSEENKQLDQAANEAILASKTGSTNFASEESDEDLNFVKGTELERLLAILTETPENTADLWTANRLDQSGIDADGESYLRNVRNSAPSPT